MENLTDPRNITTAIFYIVLACLLISSLYRDDHVTLLGLLLIVVPFLPASNLFIRVGFVVAERILYIPRCNVCVGGCVWCVGVGVGVKLLRVTV